MFQGVGLDARADRVIRRKVAFDEEPPCALAHRVGVADAPTQALDLAPVAPGEIPPDHDFRRPEKCVAQAVALEVGPVLELCPAGGGEAGHEHPVVQFHRPFQLS